MKLIFFALSIVLLPFNRLMAQSLQVNSKIDLMLIRGNYENAIDTCKQILTNDSLNPEIYQQKNSRDAYRKALNDYLVIFSSGDSSGGYLKRAGICYLSTNQFKEALNFLLPAYKSDSSDYRTCSYIGFCYYNLVIPRERIGRKVEITLRISVQNKFYKY